MIIIITGASHTGKTVLAQRMLEKYKYPYLSIDHLKMGLIRSGNTDLTPEDDEELTRYLWPIVREIIKTAIENEQNLIVEGCYVPFNWRQDFEDQYLKSIRFICLAMSDEYIRNHWDDITGHASEIESRIEDEDCTLESLSIDNRNIIDGFRRAGENVTIIEDDYEKTMLIEFDINCKSHMINYGLTGKVAIITGANNPWGIGATTALAFAREGAKVVLVYKKISRPFDASKTDRNGVDRYYGANAGTAEAVEDKLKEIGAEYIVLESDISNEDAVKEIYSTVLEKYGRVDILLNNAATDDETGCDTIEKITQSVIDDTFAVNVRGSILMIREFIKHRGDYGRIINISTDAAQAFAGQITYGASKATLEALTRSIALEVAQYGITVNCVAPGPTQTGWIDSDFEKVVIPLIPMGKLIQPQDIAGTILFLASEQARMITGQVIKVSGGKAI